MNLIEKTSQFFSENAPVILTSFAVAGVLTVTVLTAKATLEAKEIIEEEVENGHSGEFTKLELAQLVWRPYVPAIITGLLTVGCIIAAQNINDRRNAALMSVYSLSEAALREYREKVAETIGENKERKIRDEIAQDHVRENPPSKTEIFITGKGTALCYDTMSDRYFMSDMETIRKAQNDINAQIFDNMYASLNEFYSAIGIKGTCLGEEVGWSTERRLNIEFSATIVEDEGQYNGQPCMVLNYRVTPSNAYTNLH